MSPVPLITRRGFLAGIGAGAVGIAYRAGDVRAAEASPLTLGYVLGSRRDPPGTIVELRTGAIDVAPATKLRSGDPSLAGRTVTLGVHGLFGASPQQLAGSLARATFDAVLNISGERVPFYAWSFVAEPVPASGNDLAFPVRVRSVALPSFAMAETDPEGVRTKRVASFTLARESAINRLRSGVYLVPLGHDAWRRARAVSEGQGPPSLIVSVT